MTVDVLLFASYADAIGASRVAIELPADATVGDVLARVRQMASGKRVPERPMIAVNKRYARDDQRVSSTDEVAVIPPVAGG